MIMTKVVVEVQFQLQLVRVGQSIVLPKISRQSEPPCLMLPYVPACKLHEEHNGSSLQVQLNAASNRDMPHMAPVVSPQGML